MSAKPLVVERDWALARIARALGCAGYDTLECDAIMAWLSSSQPIRGSRCEACRGGGRQAVQSAYAVVGLVEESDGLTEETRFMLQGICLACRGRGFIT